ncbi:hypothetical protein [Sphingomonas jatrophae]|uniref:Uncharacterized protein n=1 Tax=Sphingomonas jatrophae TaxID=1166337 RepID=A0A1I6LLM3_9SPHN|nr:hypothetical protein [Sphingomonas jatrophae]SFS04457.1 hypothetical protein SAMN05192580_2941 [Sphingomonas jatrophae]
MRRMLGLGLALVSGIAVAQIPGTGQGVGAMVGEGLNQQALPGATLGGVTGQVRAIDDEARDSARMASDRAAAGTTPRVEAKAGVRVERGTRCYDTSGEFDAAARDGYYYCERSGAGAGAAVKARGN